MYRLNSGSNTSEGSTIPGLLIDGVVNGLTMVSLSQGYWIEFDLWVKKPRLLKGTIRPYKTLTQVENLGKAVRGFGWGSRLTNVNHQGYPKRTSCEPRL